MTCYRCQRKGHAAYESKAPAPVPCEGTYCAFKKLFRPVGTECPTGKTSTESSDSQLANAPDVLLARMSVQKKNSFRKSKLIALIYK
jgi:hypothetical protein